MTEQNKSPVDQVIESKRMEIAKNISSSFDALVANNVNNCLPESLFVEHFLPYFLGEQVTEEKQKTVITEWISVAGTPMASVDIIDPQSNVLFTVPPLYDTDIINISKRRAGNSLQDVYHEYELRGVSLPVAAQNFLASALINKTQEIVDPSKADPQLSEQWESIRKRYRQGDAQGTVKSASQNSNPDDDVIYD